MVAAPEPNENQQREAHVALLKRRDQMTAAVAPMFNRKIWLNQAKKSWQPKFRTWAQIIEALPDEVNVPLAHVLEAMTGLSLGSVEDARWAKAVAKNPNFGRDIQAVQALYSKIQMRQAAAIWILESACRADRSVSHGTFDYRSRTSLEPEFYAMPWGLGREDSSLDIDHDQADDNYGFAAVEKPIRVYDVQFKRDWLVQIFSQTPSSAPDQKAADANELDIPDMPQSGSGPKNIGRPRKLDPTEIFQRHINENKIAISLAAESKAIRSELFMIAKKQGGAGVPALGTIKNQLRGAFNARKNSAS